MQEFRESHQQGDFMQLTQITAKVHRRIPVRFSPHSHSNALAVAGQLGAVLQSITDLNPQPLGNSIGEPCTDPSRSTANSHAGFPGKESSHAEAMPQTREPAFQPVPTTENQVAVAGVSDQPPQDLVAQMSPTSKPLYSANDQSQTVPRQCTLHRYFGKAKPTPKSNTTLCPRQSQTTLHAFFPSKALAKEPPGPTVDSPTPDADTPTKQSPDQLQEVTRLANDHTVSPPSFTTSRPRLNGAEGQQRPPRPSWHIHLDNLFEEMATTVHPETGPVLHVEVWYLHHDTYPEWHAPRMVELDSTREFWYADLCMAWLDHIARTQPLRVLIVLPRPPYQLRSQADVHVVLEQGIDPQKAALHFTAIFLGGTRMGLFQRVESTSNRICTQDMIERHGFQTQCGFRTCHMHSGLLRFMMTEREEIFSGMSAVLTVGPMPTPPPDVETTGRHRPVADHEPEAEPDSDLSSTMQLGSAQPGNQTSSPNGSRPSASSRTNGTDTAMLSHRIPPHDLSEFRQTLAWHINTGPAACIHQMNAPVTVHTWFLDSLRVTHTDVSTAGSTVATTVQPGIGIYLHDGKTSWTQLCPRSSMWSHPCCRNLRMMQPPMSSWFNDPMTFGVLLLLSVSVDHRPMDSPKYYCVMLDRETDVEQLGFMSLIKHPSNPQADNYWIQAKHGEILIPADATFPVRNGFSFELTAFRRDDPWDDGTSLIQLQFAKIRQTISCTSPHDFLFGTGTHDQ